MGPARTNPDPARQDAGSAIRPAGPAGRLDPASLSEFCLLLVPIICVAMLGLRPVPLADLGLQLRLGEMIAGSGPYLDERFAAQHLGEALVPNAWLAEYLFHRLWQFGGWQLLRAVDAVLWLSAFFVVLIPARLRGERPLALAASLFAAFALALPTAAIRPQSFAALGFALTLLLVREPSRRKLALSVPMFVLWQNLHPSVSLAVLVIGTVAGIRWLLFWSSRGAAPVVQSLMLAASIAAIFATPAGTSILALSAYNTRASLLAGATEWLPLWSDHNQPMLWPVVLSVIVWLVLAWRRKAPLEEVVPAAVLVVLSLLAARFVLFYAIAVVPLLARLPLGRSLEKGHRGGRGLAAAMVAAAILLLAPVRLAPELPVAEIDKLGSARGTIFSDPAFGGAIVLRHRDVRLSHDGRFYLYTVPELNLLQQTRSNPDTLEVIVRQYEPAAFALAKGHNQALIGALRGRKAGWELAYEDRNAVIFRSRDQAR